MKRVYLSLGSNIGDREGNLRKAVERLEWHEVRVLRNRFLHEQPYAINHAAAERAFALALSSFGVFGDLQNRFCIKTERQKAGTAKPGTS